MPITFAPAPGSDRTKSFRSSERGAWGSCIARGENSCAGETLGAPLSGSITIHTGASLGALLLWLSLLSVMITAAAIAIDARRVDMVTRSNAATATVAALILVLHSDPVKAWLGAADAAHDGTANGFLVVVLIGVPLSLARALDIGGHIGGRATRSREFGEHPARAV